MSYLRTLLVITSKNATKVPGRNTFQTPGTRQLTAGRSENDHRFEKILVKNKKQIKKRKKKNDVFFYLQPTEARRRFQFSIM